MAIWLFYHHTESGPDETALNLLPRALAQGWRVALRCGPGDRAAWWDQRLWLGPEDGFLPHGIAGGPHDDRQPVLIGPEVSGQGRQALVLTDGTTATADEAAGLERVWVLFDGADPAAVDGARALWRQAQAGGQGLQYWAETAGRWEKKQERAAG